MPLQQISIAAHPDEIGDHYSIFSRPAASTPVLRITLAARSVTPDESSEHLIPFRANLRFSQFS
jgi:hypothetical protein